MPCLPRRLVLAVLLGSALASCLSPTLPLPPPSKPEISGPNEQGMVILRGTLPHPNALAFAFNERLLDGDFVKTGDDAAYRLELQAAADDELQLWYEVGNQESPKIVVRVPPPPASDGGASDAGADGASAATDAGDGG